MEKKLYELKINPEFRDALPPLKESEYEILEDKIKSNGCEMPLITWNGAIVDGHNRYRICHENNIPFEFQEKEFDSREDVRIWIVDNQLGRRNLTPFQSCEIVYPLKEALSKEAKKNQGARTDLIKGDEPAEDNFLLISTKSKGGTDTRKKLAKMANVGGFTFQHAEKLIREADEDTKRQLRAGDISINAAYNKLFGKKGKEDNADSDDTSSSIGNDQNMPNEDTDRGERTGSSEKTDGQNHRGDAAVKSEPSVFRNNAGDETGQTSTSEHMMTIEDTVPCEIEAASSAGFDIDIDMSPLLHCKGMMPEDLADTSARIVSYGGMEDTPENRALIILNRVRVLMETNADEIIKVVSDGISGIAGGEATVNESIEKIGTMVREECADLLEKLENYRKGGS